MLHVMEERAISSDGLAPADGAAQPVIRFECAPEDCGVIAPPVPAKRVMPDWFRKLPAVDPAEVSTANNALTVKRCMPFLDAMTMGWIIPLAASVRIEISENGSRFDCGWDFDKDMVSSHNVHQVAGHPRLPAPPMKFHNHWTIITPPGWSCLFVQPLNRPHPMFEIAGGIVDTDTYRSHIHFPFFATAPDGLYEIEKGTPIAQVIPFRRDASALAMAAEIGVQDAAGLAEAERIRRCTMAETGWYRKHARADR